MANPTTNYGWVLPTSTDLVTDLPADFEVALQGVDTTTKALNPATTLGDLQYRSATSNTNTRLGIGTSGQALVVSGGVPAWGTISGGGMTVLASGTLSGTTVTISSIPSTYNNLQLVIGSIRASGDAPIQIRPNGNSADYRNTEMRTLNSTASTAVPGTDAIKTATSLDMDVANDTSIVCTIFNYTSTADWKTAIMSIGSNSAANETYNALVSSTFRNTAAISSIDIFANAETFSSGTYTLYGVK